MPEVTKSGLRLPFLRKGLVLALSTLGIVVASPPATAQDVNAAVIRIDYPSLLPLSRLDLPAQSRGFAGARLATDDNRTTGQFMGQTYATKEVSVAPDEALAAFQGLMDEGHRLIVIIADSDDLLAMADAAPSDALLLNASSADVALRSAQCRANLLHIAPSDAMRTDAVAQFLVWKRWKDWFLIEGSNPADHVLADSYRASARKFGARITEERVFQDTGGSRVSDSGHVLVQRQIPVFTQDAAPHDVVVAADASDVFAEYLPYHLWDPASVAGSAGLRPLTWAPTHESWGATQIQRRFEELAGRNMTDIDYQTWLALRVLGEAVTRTASADPAVLRDYILSPEFELAAFKGVAVTFRPWNGQMRQPILLSNGRMTVSVSPQEGFLHEVSPLDTLGLDRPESECTAFEGED
ncbi:ABC transporter substrate-binding protein [Puniceibacterium sediminis]|uniref:ABC transporter, substrate binding protein, PQQ-dependent alcohol dehydrogenase system n=1 Tax=Puniceibacterium sediminis TaxID=1608407 RepID=A0A238XZT9_9RHOB|nr:ABC transporter substrate-binding protein [Puniceibacterium sediminis]SNR63559.1 ABC transporter, substrate binding protein, PQQ-dependent alcohol dehydrogenase system [Puniceibacterium sediminis]